MVQDALDVDLGQLPKMELTHNIVSRQEAGSVAAKMCQIMGRAGWRNPRQTEQDESILLAVQKGAWSRLGVYVVHLSILVQPLATIQFYGALNQVLRLAHRLDTQRAHARGDIHLSTRCGVQ